MSSQAYEAQVSAMYLKSLETEHNNSYKDAKRIFKEEKKFMKNYKFCVYI